MIFQANKNDTIYVYLQWQTLETVKKKWRERNIHNKHIKKLNSTIIKTVPFRAPPRYNPRRRSGLGFWMNYQHSSNSSETYSTLRPTSSIGSTNSSWANSQYHAFVRLMSHEIGLGPPSPCPSDHPFNSASSSLSESSSSHRSQEDDISIVTGKLRYTE